MEQMKPMQPMKAMEFGEPWWPEDLGKPATAGGQGDAQYAFFPDKHRLAIREGGEIVMYNTGEHQIIGAAQKQGSISTLSFATKDGDVSVAELSRAD